MMLAKVSLHCILKYEHKKPGFYVESPSLWSFSSRKSWKIQSKAFGCFFQFSIRFSRLWFEIWNFLLKDCRISYSYSWINVPFANVWITVNNHKPLILKLPLILLEKWSFYSGFEIFWKLVYLSFRKLNQCLLIYLFVCLFVYVFIHLPDSSLQVSFSTVD